MITEARVEIFISGLVHMGSKAVAGGYDSQEKKENADHLLVGVFSMMIIFESLSWFKKAF